MVRQCARCGVSVGIPSLVPLCIRCWREIQFGPRQDSRPRGIVWKKPPMEQEEIQLQLPFDSELGPEGFGVTSKVGMTVLTRGREIKGELIFTARSPIRGLADKLCANFKAIAQIEVPAVVQEFASQLEAKGGENNGTRESG